MILMDEDFFAHLLEQIDYTPKVLLVLVSKSSASGEGRRRPLVRVIISISSITKVFFERLDGGVYGGGGRGGKSGHV